MKPFSISKLLNKDCVWLLQKYVWTKNNYRFHSEQTYFRPNHIFSTKNQIENVSIIIWLIIINTYIGVSLYGEAEIKKVQVQHDETAEVTLRPKDGGVYKNRGPVWLNHFSGISLDPPSKS